MIIDDLERVGLLSCGEIPKELLYEPQDPTLLIPRRAHREATRRMLETLRVHYDVSLIPAIVLFGKASWGESTYTLNIAVLLDIMAHQPPHFESFAQLFESVTVACGNNTSQLGALFNIFFTAKEVWLYQQLDLLMPASHKIAAALSGICIHGNLPSIDDLFEMSRRVLPSTEQWIAEKLAKGYLKPICDNKYSYTDKAIQRFSWPVEACGGGNYSPWKKLPVLFVEPPETK
jgi:hypothetical protein